MKTFVLSQNPRRTTLSSSVSMGFVFGGGEVGGSFYSSQTHADQGENKESLVMTQWKLLRPDSF